MGLHFTAANVLIQSQQATEDDVTTFVPQGMGWLPDLPDARDYTFRHPQVLELLRALQAAPDASSADQVDLRCDCEGEYFNEPRNQGSLNSSTAFAVLSLVEYFERRLHGRTFEGSARFLYKVTRNILQKRACLGEPFHDAHSSAWQLESDTGSDIRTALKVLTRFGVPPEDYWPYDITRFDEEPTAFHYALAKPFSNLRYFRLDEPNISGEATWATVKSFLAAGFPIVFGFSVPTSMTSLTDIPYRPYHDGVRGGIAAITTGYRINHYGPRRNALLIRTSWGSQCGDNGSAWLPAVFLRDQLARDFWTVISADWLDSQELTRPSVVD